MRFSASQLSIAGIFPSHFDSASGPERDNALDFVRGVLVVGMLLYHEGTVGIVSADLRNLFVGGFLNFVTGGWLFVTGFVLAMHYAPSYELARRSITIRLLTRSLKITTLFVALNCLLLATGLAKSTWAIDTGHLARVFFHGGGQLSSFEVLVGIGWLLLIAPVLLLLLTHVWNLIIVVLFIASAATSLGLSFSPNLWLVVCGLWGVAIGHAMTSRRDIFLAWMRVRPWKFFSILIIGATVHLGTFSTQVAHRGDLLVYMLGVVSLFSLFYYGYEFFRPTARAVEFLQIVGRYSLFSYIFQMGVIWAWLSVLQYAEAEPFFLRDLLVVTGILFVSVALLHRLNATYQGIHRVYAGVFG